MKTFTRSFGLVAHIIEPIVGLLGDIWRRYWLIVLGGLAFSASLILFASATSFWGLMLAMVLFYPASGTFVSLSQPSPKMSPPPRSPKPFARFDKP